MAKQVVNLGTSALKGRDGDPNRISNTKFQENFDEIYTALGVNGEGVLPQALPISKGGTNATTLAQAKQNLGIDAVNLELTNLSQSITLALSGKEPTLTAGATTQYYRGDKTWQTLNKNAVGLGNVDNTSDALKPISTATQLALNDKQNKTDVQSIAKGGTGATTDAAARTNLGLGDAATKTVGKVSGNVPAIINFDGVAGQGYAGKAPVIPDGTDFREYPFVTGWYGLGGTYLNAPVANSMTSQMMVSLRTYGAGAAMIFQVWHNSAADYYVGQSTWTAVGDGTYKANSAIVWKKVYTTGNTTVDANGFIKAASPVVQIYADRIEMNEEAAEQSITFEKIGVGDYLIKGSTGFAQEGWYVEQPKDANGNIYHVVIYDTLANGDITLKTYEKALNAVGDRVPDLTNPVDIKVDRFIAIRLEPLLVEDTYVDETTEQL